MMVRYRPICSRRPRRLNSASWPMGSSVNHEMRRNASSKFCSSICTDGSFGLRESGDGTAGLLRTDDGGEKQSSNVGSARLLQSSATRPFSLASSTRCDSGGASSAPPPETSTRGWLAGALTTSAAVTCAAVTLAAETGRTWYRGRGGADLGVEELLRVVVVRSELVGRTGNLPVCCRLAADGGVALGGAADDGATVPGSALDRR
jgi:hypothetical protein